MIIQKKDKDRFFKNTQKNENGCLIWTGSIHKSYGYFWIKPKEIRAHRFAWIIKFGEIPNNLLVCHKCDNPLCVNWEHLWLGTPFQNCRDKMLKGRFKCGAPKKKLSEEQENEIYNLYKNTFTTHKELAEKFNVSKSLIIRTLSYFRKNT